MRTLTITAFTEYAAAIEKCDAFVGGTKNLCVSDAKALYGKS